MAKGPKVRRQVGLSEEIVAIEDLHEDPNNARAHDERNLDAIEASLRKWGQVEPLVVQRSTGMVIGGNARLHVMRDRLKWTKCRVIKLDISDVDARALGVALNRTAELADWDEANFRETLEVLEDAGIDIEGLLFFNDEEIEDILGETIEEVEEDESPVKAPRRVNRGEVWQLGPHRLVCGDARKPGPWREVLEGRKVQLVVTSPPYADRRKYDASSGFKPIRPDRYVDWYAPVARRIWAVLAPKGTYILNIRGHTEDGERLLYTTDLLLAHAREWRWRFIEDFAWTHGGTPRRVDRRFKNAWEPIYQFAKTVDFDFYPDKVIHKARFRPTPLISSPEGGEGLHPSMKDGKALQGKRIPKKRKSHRASEDQGKPEYGSTIRHNVTEEYDGFAYPSNVLSLGRNREALGHGAAFPVALPSFFIQAYSRPGEVVCDPFTGSGSTLMACEQLGRPFVGIEISTTYCDLIVERWMAATGKKAKRV